MRHVRFATMAFIAGVIVSGPSSHAAPGPVLAATAGNVAGGMIQKVDYWHRYYRQHGYAPGTVVVIPAPVPAPVPDASPPAVEVAPILVPVRPLSCGEYHYWDGVQCVDARFNKPYLGPR
jgi:hypothetical protein